MFDEQFKLKLEYLYLAKEIDEFLFREVDLLDERRYDEWLALFADDVRYWMPMRKNMAFHERDRDITGSDDIAWIDDDKVTLAKRVAQIQTGVHWAEEPMSRVSHLISNIRFEDPRRSLAEGETILVRSHFIFHRSRLHHDKDIMAGRRSDTLRRVGGSFQIAQRTIIIDESVLMAKNLSFF